MRKALSVFLLAFTGLVLLVAVACGIFLASFDPNDYKRQIASVVENATGRQLFFQDDMTFSFFPGLRLKTGRLELNDPGEFGPEPFLRLGGATFSLAL